MFSMQESFLFIFDLQQQSWQILTSRKHQLIYAAAKLIACLEIAAKKANRFRKLQKGSQFILKIPIYPSFDCFWFLSFSSIKNLAESEDITIISLRKNGKGQSM